MTPLAVLVEGQESHVEQEKVGEGLGGVARQDDDLHINLVGVDQLVQLLAVEELLHDLVCII